jgi:glutathione S-transferase
MRKCPLKPLYVFLRRTLPQQAKFICRTFAPNLYPESDIVAATQIDQYIEIGTKLNGASARNAKVMLKDTNTHLGKNDFLCGSSLTLADIALFTSTQQNAAGTKEKNIKVRSIVL